MIKLSSFISESLTNNVNCTPNCQHLQRKFPYLLTTLSVKDCWVRLDQQSNPKSSVEEVRPSTKPPVGSWCRTIMLEIRILKVELTVTRQPEWSRDLKQITSVFTGLDSRSERFKQYHNCSSTRMTLALNISRRLICH